MKKRIISLILVLVMLCLALASCGYSIADEDISKYATFDEDSKLKLEEALKKLSIKDGDFTTDEETRKNKVIDSIYKDLATSSASDAEEVKEGKPADHDIIYYNYYFTAEIDGKTYYFNTTNMKSGTTTSIQLGLADPTDFEKAVAALFADLDFKDKTYKTDTSGEVKEGDVVYVTYSYTHNVPTDDGTATKPETVTATNERIVLTKGASALVDHLLNNKATINSSSIKDFEDNGKSYTGIKINWREASKEIGTVKYVTYTDSKDSTVKDVTGAPKDLKDKELTYHIYPAYYHDIPEFTAVNFVNIILGDSITYEAITRVLFGEKFADKTDDEKKAIVDNYITKDGDKDVTLEELVKAISTAQKEYDSALAAKEKAEGDVNTKQATYNSAKSKYDAEPNDERKSALDTAETNLNNAKKELETATTTYNEKLATRDNKVKTLIDTVNAKKDMAAGRNDLVDGYKVLTYEYLRDIYNEEVRMNLAEAVYALFNDVTVNSLPEKAVDESYNRLIENFEYDFYNGTDEASKQSYYSINGGDFKEFLKAKITETRVQTTDYEMALREVRKMAEEYVKPIVIIYAISEAYGIVATEEEYEEYMESEDSNYESKVFNYGENSVRYAYQFDKLMNYILEYEELDNGSYSYKKVVFTTDAE